MQLPYHNTIYAFSIGRLITDKFDSSFTRSRSSSCSSNANPNELASQQHQQQQQCSANESIQCLCFLDWTLATHLASPLANTSSGFGMQSGSAVAAGQLGGASSASIGVSNKSPSSIEANSSSQLALWLGTSQGCILLVSLAMPDSEDNRVLQLQSVNAEPIPQASIKLPGSILCLSTFTLEPTRGQLIGAPPGGASGQTHGLSQESPSEMSAQTGPSSSSNSANTAINPTGFNSRAHGQSLSSPHSSMDSSRASTFLSIVSEKEAEVFQIPTLASSPKSADHHHHHHHQQQQQHHHKQTSLQSDIESPMAKLLTNKANCLAKLELSDSSFACRSSLVQMRQPDESCLVSFMATGNIVVHSLPKLKPILLDADFVPYTGARLSSSMCFSRNGHCLYQPSASEICKFTISSQYANLLGEMTGSLHVTREMPEMPRGNFFKTLFSVTNSAASKQSDRDELFGECSAGKASRGVAKHISSGSSSGLEKLKNAAVGTMGHDLRVAREGLDERGEKLSEIEDRTLQMMNQSESYAQSAYQLAQKFKDKKWYQF